MAAGAGRNKKLLPYKGEMLTLDELALLSPGVSRTRILKRIGDGWSIDDAVETPPRYALWRQDQARQHVAGCILRQ